MTECREICELCEQEFSPLSSARGIEADVCINCRIQGFTGEPKKKTVSSIKIRDGRYPLQEKHLPKLLYLALIIGVVYGALITYAMMRNT